MKHWMASLLLVLLVACGGERPAKPAASPGLAPAAAPAPPGVFDFEADAEGGPPKGLQFGLTGEGRPGLWVVRAPEGGTGRVLAQTDADPTDQRYPVAFAAAPALADVKVSVRCRALSGLQDQGVGLIWRVADQRNYYLARVNALEGNARIYCVKDGWRRPFGSADVKVEPVRWHELSVEVKGNRHRVVFDGAVVLDAEDSVLSNAGGAGVWTKADTVAEFDDLRIQPL